MSQTLSKQEYLVRVVVKKTGAKYRSYIITIPKKVAESLGLTDGYVVLRYDPQTEALIIKKAKVVA